MSADEKRGCDKCGAYPFFGGAAPESCPFCASGEREERLTPERVRELLELAEKATPGPWDSELDVFDADGSIDATVADKDVEMLATIHTGVYKPVVNEYERWTAEMEAASKKAWAKAGESQAIKDARFIAAAREALPAALREVETLCAENARMREALRLADPRNAGELYDLIADNFRRKTGKWAPGKDAPAAFGSVERGTHEEWRAFVDKWHEDHFDRAIGGEGEA